MAKDGMPAELRRRGQDAGESWRAFVLLCAEGMTMTARTWAMAAAGLLLLGGTQLARAEGDGDTYRLGGTGDDAVTTRLTWNGQADTVLTRGSRGGFGYGGHYGHVGHYGGYRAAHYGGFYHHHYPYYRSFYGY